MPAQASQVRACMTQHLLQDAWARGVNRSLAERLAQVAESPLGSQVQSAACSSNKRSRTATLSDEQLVADLEHHYQQCLQAYIDSSTSPDHPPDFEDEAAFSLFQQDTAAHREAEALLEADAEQESLLQAAAHSALAEQEACCQQLHYAAELMSKPHKFSEIGIHEVTALQGTAQRFLNICNDVRDNLHEQEIFKLQQEKLQITKALRDAKAMAASSDELYLELKHSKLRLEERMEAEADKHKCCICMTKQKDALVLPCMHMDYCVMCMDKHMQRSATCPLCRAPVRGIIPTLRAQG